MHGPSPPHICPRLPQAESQTPNPQTQHPKPYTLNLQPAQVREEELAELDDLARDVCPFETKGGVENSHGKVAILLQVPQTLIYGLGFRV